MKNYKFSFTIKSKLYFYNIIIFIDLCILSRYYFYNLINLFYQFITII